MHVPGVQERRIMLTEKLKERLQPYVDGDKAGFTAEVRVRCDVAFLMPRA